MLTIGVQARLQQISLPVDVPDPSPKSSGALVCSTRASSMQSKYT